MPAAALLGAALLGAALDPVFLISEATDADSALAPSTWEGSRDGFRLSAPSAAEFGVTLRFPSGDSLPERWFGFVNTSYRTERIDWSRDAPILLLRESKSTTYFTSVDRTCGQIVVEAWMAEVRTTVPLWSITSRGCDTAVLGDPQGKLLHVAGEEHSGDWTPDFIYDLATGRELFAFHEKFLTVRIPNTTLRRFVTSYIPPGDPHLPLVEGKRALLMLNYGPRPEAEQVVIYAAQGFWHLDGDIWFATGTWDGPDELELTLETVSGKEEPELFDRFSVVVEWREHDRSSSKLLRVDTFKIPVEHDHLAPEHAVLPEGFEYRRIKD